MTLTKEKKKELFQTLGAGQSIQDSGSTESQIALFFHRIQYLTEHLRVHKKDHAAKFGLKKLVGKQKQSLAYLKKKQPDRYKEIINKLGIRK